MAHERSQRKDDTEEERIAVLFSNEPIAALEFQADYDIKNMKVDGEFVVIDVTRRFR